MKIIVLINFDGFSDEGLVAESLRITGKMTGNAYFPTPKPTVEETIIAQNEYITALNDSYIGGTRETTLKNKKRAILVNLLSKLGLYVQLNCKDDLTIVQTTGYDTQKDGESKGVLPAPGDLKVVIGPYPGSIKISVSKVDGAHTYLYEWKELPATDTTPWEFDLGKRSMIIPDLKQGKEYAFRVAAKGAALKMVFTEIVNHFVA